MKQKKLVSLKNLLLGSAAVLAVGALTANDANATNGYFAHGYSIKNKGLAGAGVALPLDALAASMNPAGMTEVGQRLDLGISLFSPNRSYEVKGNPSGFAGTFPLVPGTENSDSNYFGIPSIGYNYMLTDHSSIGISVYGNGGMNTDYDTATFNYVDPSLPDSSTGVDLIQLFIAPTYAHKFGGKHSFGITPIIAIQFFEAKGTEAFGGFSSAPNKLSDNGHDSSYGFGARVGYLGQLTDKFSIGLSYQSEIDMDEFDDYAGLFAEQGDFDIPQNFTVGFAFKPIPAVRFAFDWQRIYYSDVNSIANPFLPNLMTAQLGDNKGAGFGWEDMDIFKFGLEWERTEQWTYRFGYSFSDDQPIPDSEVMFNILAPATIEQHASFGFTRTFDSQNELDFAFTYAFNNSVKGDNPMEAPGQQTIVLEMHQWEVSLGYSWVF
ncbi:MAG: outer membrane protein transport protein [Proteobacteria bacterium]|nr:outer membrane protein transport protein [Pseudomonadota bacterium]